jgi:uncharacterized protein YllA (UPF0747 family)
MFKTKQAKKKELKKIWYEQQDEPIAIKNLGKEFRIKARNQGYNKKEIDKFLKDW